MNERITEFLVKVVALLTSRRAWVVAVSLYAVWGNILFPDIPEEQLIETGTVFTEGAMKVVASAIIVFGWLVSQGHRKTG